MTKAFNNVDLNILLNKLFKYGIRGDMLDFFDSYLKNRTYRTKVNGEFSKYITTNRGVGQGTNLGPLFFNLFVNDVERVIEHCTLFIYADDLVLLKSSRDLNLLKNCINSDLDNLYRFFARNNQYVNFTKTQAMLFTRHKNVDLTISMNSTSIQFVKEFTYLGLTIDEKLTFKTHISNISKKVNQANGKIYYLKRFLPIFVLKKIFYSLIYSHLNLHILCWGGTYNSLLNPLIVSVNKTIRNIYPTDDRTHLKYQKLNILTVPQIYNLRLAEFFFRLTILGENFLLYDILNEITFNHSHNTRHIDDYRLPAISTDMNKHFFLTNAIKFWRTLPLDIRNSTSIQSFRFKIKNLYLNQDSLDFG